MAKPIFIMKIPAGTANEMAETGKLAQMMKKLRRELDDYHVLVMADNHVTEAGFQCFNADNVPEIELSALKEMCMNAVKEKK